jgi:peptidoglycan/LPS O-acetylase OafA/YrhL
MKLTYRPEIDGLRAFAVVAIIIYHAQITILDHKLLKGGYFGVDIFFVISGYLITSIILKELFETNSFSFKYFYERRIRRILPTLLLVISISLPFAWIYLLPTNFIDYSKSIIFSLTFISNIYFLYSLNDYFSLSAFLRPFLHTWSLSIEEQFYILLPISLFIAFKYFKKYLFILLVLTFAITLQYSNLMTETKLNYSFWNMHTRIWELLAGSVLAHLEIQLGHRSKNKILNTVFASTGLILIIYCIIFFDNKISHPSFYTLILITGTCLIIWFCNKNELITRILSWKLFVGTGLISYSLYLWHYPIFFFNGIVFNYNKILIIILTIIVSIISYFFIEKPARNKQFNFKVISLFIFIPFIFLIFFHLKSIYKDGFEKRFYNEGNVKLSNVGHSKYITEFMKNYNYENYDGRENVLIIGNCFGWNIFNILSKTTLAKHYYFTSALLEDKNSAFEVEYLYNFLKNKKNPIKFNKLFEEQYAKSKYIILASEYTNQDIDILSELIQLLISDGKKILIFDYPLHQELFTAFQLNWLDHYFYVNKKFPSKKELKNLENKAYQDFDKNKNINLKIKIITEEKKIPLIKRNKLFCDEIEKKCDLLTKLGYKIYWDIGHTTEKGAEFFSKKIENDKIFLEFLNSASHTSSN